MKLYDYTAGPNPRRVRIFLAEKGIEVPLEQVDLPAGGARDDAMLKRNPFGGIPVLELDDGSHLAESVAICRYFEGLHPEPPLFGRTPLEQARIEMWDRRIEIQIFRTVGMIWVHGHPLTARLLKQIPEVADQNRGNLARLVRTLDRCMADQEYIAGDAYSVADISALCVFDFAAFIGEPLPDDAEHLQRWHRAVSARPSAKA